MASDIPVIGPSSTEPLRCTSSTGRSRASKNYGRRVNLLATRQWVEISGPLVTATGLHSNRHATAAKAEINQLGHGELVLLENVETHHTQLGLPIAT